jgi:hypothetical protein
MTDQEDEFPMFDQWHWFWKIEGDDTRYWSSESGTYVSSADPKRTTIVPDETQLIEVLAHLGLTGP